MADEIMKEEVERALRAPGEKVEEPEEAKPDEVKAETKDAQEKNTEERLALIEKVTSRGEEEVPPEKDKEKPAEEDSSDEEVEEETAEEEDTGDVTETADVVYFSPALLARAKRHETSVTEARSFGSPDALEEYLDALDQEADTGGEKKKPDEKPGFVSNLDAEDVDETVIAEFNRMGKEHQEEMAELKKQFAELTGKDDDRSKKAEQAEMVRESKEFDKWADSLDEPYDSILGKNVTWDEKNKKLLEARNELFQMCEYIKGFYERPGVKKPPIEEIRQKALEALYGAKDNTKKVTKEIADKVKKRADQITPPSVGGDVKDGQTVQQQREAIVNKYTSR